MNRRHDQDAPESDSSDSAALDGVEDQAHGGLRVHAAAPPAQQVKEGRQEAR